MVKLIKENRELEVLIGSSIKEHKEQVKRETKGLSPQELMQVGHHPFVQGITPELREFLREKTFSPRISYKMAMYFLGNVFEDIQEEDIRHPAAFLDFGAGDGFSFMQFAELIDVDVFRSVCLYDIKKTDLYYLNNIRFEEACEVEYTNERPESQFDFVNMSFVAGVDSSSVNQATSVMRDGGYISIFDYNLKGMGEEGVRDLCSTDLERGLIQTNGFDSFYQRATQHGISDYAHQLEGLGVETYLQQEIGDKFCVVVGKKPISQ